jgi:hypothetical protein
MHIQYININHSSNVHACQSEIELGHLQSHNCWTVARLLDGRSPEIQLAFDAEQYFSRINTIKATERFAAFRGVVVSCTHTDVASQPGTKIVVIDESKVACTCSFYNVKDVAPKQVMYFLCMSVWQSSQDGRIEFSANAPSFVCTSTGMHTIDTPVALLPIKNKPIEELIAMSKSVTRISTGSV